MESLALAVTIILFGLLFISLVGPVIAIAFRKKKLHRYWVIGFLVLLGALTILAWQGSAILGSIPLVALALTAAISFWPNKNIT